MIFQKKSSKWWSFRTLVQKYRIKVSLPIPHPFACSFLDNRYSGSGNGYFVGSCVGHGAYAVQLHPDGSGTARSKLSACIRVEGGGHYARRAANRNRDKPKTHEISVWKRQPGALRSSGVWETKLYRRYTGSKICRMQQSDLLQIKIPEQKFIYSGVKTDSAKQHFISAVQQIASSPRLHLWILR